MASANNFQQVFSELRDILTKFERHLDVEQDTDNSYFLNSRVLRKNKKPVCFGGVRIQKNYVSYYLMSVYTCPNLLSTRLKARMQGKACFNFTTVDDELFKELARLTKEGYHQFKHMGLI